MKNQTLPKPTSVSLLRNIYRFQIGVKNSIVVEVKDYTFEKAFLTLARTYGTVICQQKVVQFLGERPAKNIKRRLKVKPVNNTEDGK